MKVIFSRKGFDTTYGGFPSPIFPDGTIYSVPIPSKLNDKKFCELRFNYHGEPLQKILNQLTKKRIKARKLRECDYLQPKFRCHLDPFWISKKLNYALGQVGAALKHLENNQIEKDDIFLFYGLFQEIENRNGEWCYIKSAPKIHLIFASMIVGEIIPVMRTTQKCPPFLGEHPHFDANFSKKYINKNVIFIGQKSHVFKYDIKRVLTDLKNYKGASKWRLPLDFDFSHAITYISQVKVEKDEVVLQRQGPGQEYILNLNSLTSLQKTKFLRYLHQLLS